MNDRDKRGNRTEKAVAGGDTTLYTYDTHDRLTEADLNGSTVFTAAYDYRTRRVSKTGNGDTTHYRNDGGTTFQELDGEGHLETEFVRGSGQGGGIGSILYTAFAAPGPDEPAEFYHYNPVGHTVANTDDAGVVTKTNAYEAFGQIVAETGASDNTHLANTKERDASINLDNHGFRYYDPTTGLYLTKDPLGYPDGLNNYLYVNNNPINKIDPQGLVSVSGIWNSTTSAIGGAADATAGAVSNAASATAEFAQDSAQAAAAAAVEVGDTAADAGGQALSLATTGSMSGSFDDGDQVASSFVGGAGTGGKAIVNAGADTVVSTATLGAVDNTELIGVSDWDRQVGYNSSYAASRVGTEILGGLATGYAGTAAKGGKAVSYTAKGIAGLDAANNLATTARGGINASQNGLDLQNSTQLAGGVLGLTGNVAGATRGLKGSSPEASDNPFVLSSDVTVGGRAQAPPISSQKQARHAADWAAGLNGRSLVSQAWREGTPFKGQPDQRLWSPGYTVGKKGESKIMTHHAPSKGYIHGYPKEGEAY